MELTNDLKLRLKPCKRRIKGSLKYLAIDKRKKDCNFYSTNAFHYYGCIFVHVPKTGGVSIAKSLFGNLGGGHATVKEYETAFQENYEQYFKFSFVRNPWDRIYSAFCFLKDGGFDIGDKIWTQNNEKYLTSFETFILGWLSEESIKTKIHFLPQIYFLKNSFNKIDLDFIGRFEKLDEDFEAICSRLKTKEKLQHLNWSKRSVDYRNAYSVAMRKKVHEIYNEDISLFKYNFNTIF